ncbi:MAG TPA: hypothetical protein VEO19_02185 [Terriglobia bacterium]|nr:hypothetical protein [Terriglobia bacterium]
MDTAPNRSSESNIGTYVESFARGMAALLVAIYGIGFVILCAYEAGYGILQFSPLRARIFAVGFAFTALVALPVAAHHYKLAYYGPLEPVLRNTDQAAKNDREVVLACGFIYTAFFMAGAFSLLLLSVPSAKSDRWWHGVLFVAGYCACLGIFAIIGKAFASHPRIASVAAFLTCCGSAACIYLINERTFALTLWFFTCGVGAQHVRRATDRLRFALDFRNWLFAIVNVWIYVAMIFGTVPPKLGGGAPTPVVLYLNRPAAWLDSTVASASLLDETDQGFYVLTPGKNKALYIPRSDVSSVYFGPAEEVTKSK